MTWHDRFDARVVKADSCWVWVGHKYVSGYGQLKVNGRPRRTHRLSYERFVGPIPDGLFVLHTCDTPACVNPEHLYVGTHGDNMRDRRDRNRHWARGRAEHGMAKLTEDAVSSLRSWHAAGGWTYADLGRAFGVSGSNVGLIIRRKGWV